MSLSSTHKEYILERLHKEYLYNSIIPTSDELEADLLTYQEEHPNFDEPLSKTVDFSVEHGGHASASKIQTISDTVSDDIGIITREIYKLAKDSSKFYDRWSMEMKRLGAVAKKLEQRVDSLLLLNSDSAGYFAHVGDVFVDMNIIDTENTTAKINLYENSVSINPDSSSAIDASGGSLIDLSHMRENDVSFVPLSHRPGTVYFTTNAENSLYQLFRPTNTVWVGKVVSDTTGDMICEMKANVSIDKDIEVSKISFNYTGPNSTSRSTVTCMYSDNGYTWNLVPTAEATKSLVPNLAWFFPKVSLRWIKFIFTKPAPDNSNNEYIFAASSIRLYGQTYEDTGGNVFISNALSALDTSDEIIRFSTVALSTCEEIPDNTGINYYISASKDNTVWTDWAAISPTESIGVSYPKVLNIGGADWKDNKIEDDTVLLDTSVTIDGTSQQKITNNFDSSYTGYRFKDTTFGVVNTAINISVNEDPDPIANSVVMWRNIRYKDKTNYPDTLTVRGVPRGWGLDGSTYSCYFEVINSNGIIIDFGDNYCVLDDQQISGVVTIPSGIHKFSTDANNWYNISDNIVTLGSVVSSEETLESIDPLYPHNHKLLIEGFPYVSNFTGDKKYTGTDMSAEFYAKKTSLFELENNINNFGYFSIRGVGNDSTNATLAAILRYRISDSDYSNELFCLKWRSGEAEASMYKYIKLKAVLWTSDTSVSPILSSYRIKLGL